jgi:D-aminopeptidase
MTADAGAGWRPHLGSLPAGRYDAITDVPGVRVGHTTLIQGDGPLRRGVGPIRTGVTIIRPHDGSLAGEPLFAGHHVLNGNGEVTGLTWLAESGLLSSDIGLTNTHSVGLVRDTVALLQARDDHGRGEHSRGDEWYLPVVGETWDGMLNDINGAHVRPEHVEQAHASATDGPVSMGNVGGGTGMICHGFKGGIGSSSRIVHTEAGAFTVGVLVQANHGRRERLQIDGTAVGRAIDATVVPLPGPGPVNEGAGSIVAVAATDAPLLPHQCRRLAQRVGLGVARVGGVGEHSSGDVFVAFSTGSRGIPPDVNARATPATYQVTVLHNAHITALFDAVVEATEQAIVNALLAASTMEGRDGNVAYALGTDRLRAAFNSHR